ncbi:MAG: ABC transporter permease [Bacilli bacterium]
MLNKTLYKYGIKSNLKIFFIFIFLITMYISVICSMYNKESQELLYEFSKTMPEMMTLFGMNGELNNSYISFLISYLYGFILLIIPMIFSIILSNKLISSYVENKSMSYLLSSSNKRIVIFNTQFCVLMTFETILSIYITSLILILSTILFPLELNLNKFIILNTGLFAFNILLSNISLFFSTLTNESNSSYLYGAGSLLFFYLIQMLVNFGGNLDKLKYFTIFTLFDSNGLINFNTISIIFIFIIICIIISLYLLAKRIFIKKDLHV